MRLIRAELGNFGSYEHLDFTFDRPGLTLIQGATGSGKSTLFDAPAWVLYGITAKDGSVDDVRSWNDLTLPTVGRLELETRGVKLTVFRIRGRPNENDLYWIEENNPNVEHRGTNIKETQVLLDAKLGVDSGTYLAASYFCEYSPSSTFFVSNATQRRVLFDRVANLAFPTAIAAHLSDKITEAKKTFLKSQSDIVSLTRQFNLISSNLKDSTSRSDDWDSMFVNKIQELQDKILNFNNKKKQDIDFVFLKFNKFELERTNDLDLLQKELSHNTNEKGVCRTCGAETSVNHSNEIIKEIDKITHLENPHNYSLNEVSNRVNTIDIQLQEHLKQVNPFKGQVAHFVEQKHSISSNLKDEQKSFEKLKSKVENYEHLKDLTSELKERLLKNSVEMIQHRANENLTKYFDGELSVDFIVVGSNALDITIFKNGHEAVYKQLSKGQRQLLKIAFSVAVMRTVSERSGIHFNSVFFDEALDGLDTDLKVKTFNLFSSLEMDHGSVFVIDHAEEFKNMFTQRYLVSITADVSTLVYEQ